MVKQPSLKTGKTKQNLHNSSTTIKIEKAGMLRFTLHFYEYEKLRGEKNHCISCVSLKYFEKTKTQLHWIWNLLMRNVEEVD
jgi:hypothetical protein